MVQATLLIGAFAALAAAIPQQAEHISKAQLTRVNQVFARNDGVLELAGRGISMDGSCGSTSGLSCGQGNCCSSLGWCGATPLHCGTDCQAGFGKCGTDGAEAPAAAESPAPSPEPAPAATVEPAPAPAALQKAPEAAPVQPAAAPAAPLNDQSSAQSGGDTLKQSGSSSGGDSGATKASGSSSGGMGDKYSQYSGDGSSGAGWPSEDQWVDFETSFSANKATMKASCAQFGQADPSDEEVQNIHDSILSASSSSGVDSRFVLAILMQESKGCVRVPTTNWGVRNPGLMQSFNGQGTCNEGGVQNPCPASTISQMINDGTSGTGPGSNSLSSALERAGGSDSSKYYKAARIYNSGSVAGSGMLQDGIATHCYSSDVANRLTGWTSAASSCTYDH